MFGFTGRKRVGQSADVERRSFRTGASRWVGALTATLLVLAGPIASLWIGVSPAAASALTQIGPFNGTTTTTGWSAFTSQLATTGQGSFTVSYATTLSTACGVFVSSSGAISTTGTLHTGSCTVSGTDSDTNPDSGTWAFTLTTTAVALTQNGPATGTVTTTGSSAFTSQLATNGPAGLVSFVTTSVACGVVVSSSGAISTTGTLHSGSCVVSGTDSDTAGDTAGTWTYTLTITAVTITQSGSASGSTTTAASSAFTSQLATTGPAGLVSFVTTSVACGVVVSSSGAISTTGSLHTGSCVVSGTDSDTAGDTAGTWTYTLTITAVTITQSGSASGSTTTAASSAFTSQLATTGPAGLVSFVTTSVACGVVVSSSGAISTTGSLHTGSCVVSGT